VKGVSAAHLAVTLQQFDELLLIHHTAVGGFALKGDHPGSLPHLWGGQACRGTLESMRGLVLPIRFRKLPTVECNHG